jgi:hypothetical protein
MTREQRPALTTNHRNRLREILITGTGEDASQCEALLVLLEDAVHKYPHMRINPWKTIAREHLRAARQCEQAILRFRRTLDSIERRRGWENYVGGDSTSLAALPLASLMALANSERTWPAWKTARRRLDELLEDNRTCIRSARAKARKRHGSSESRAKRIRLAHWLAYHLAKVGIWLARSEKGQFARTLAIVYQAAGEEVKSDLFRDVQEAIERLTVSHPHLVQPRTSTAGKGSGIRAESAVTSPATLTSWRAATHTANNEPDRPPRQLVLHPRVGTRRHARCGHIHVWRPGQRPARVRLPLSRFELTPCTWVVLPNRMTFNHS